MPDFAQVAGQGERLVQVRVPMRADDALEDYGDMLEMLGVRLSPFATAMVRE